MIINDSKILAGKACVCIKKVDTCIDFTTDSQILNGCMSADRWLSLPDIGLADSSLLRSFSGVKRQDKQWRW